MTDSEQSKARRHGGRRGRVFVADDIRRDPVDVNLSVAALVMIAQDLAAEREQDRAGRAAEEEPPRRTRG